MVGDGSYLMLNSEIATSVMLGAKLIVVVLDNRGFGCINRLQQATGGAPFNNLLPTRATRACRRSTSPPTPPASARGSEKVAASPRWRRRWRAPRPRDRTYVIVIDTDPAITTEAGGAWWDVAVPEVSDAAARCEAARAAYEARAQRSARETENLDHPLRRQSRSPGSTTTCPSSAATRRSRPSCADARDIGFAGIELGGKFPRDAGGAEAAAGRLRPRPGRRLVVGAAADPRRRGRDRRRGRTTWRCSRPWARRCSSTPRPATPSTASAAAPLSRDAAAGAAGWPRVRRAADRVRGLRRRPGPAVRLPPPPGHRGRAAAAIWTRFLERHRRRASA